MVEVYVDGNDEVEEEDVDVIVSSDLEKDFSVICLQELEEYLLENVSV